MAIKYDLHLKGFVGGWDFDSEYVDYVLSRKQNQEVNVLIDSLGGRLDTALSIFSAFQNHGNVLVHLCGMNASAATVVAMGAKHITMDRYSFFLVHKGSIDFFKWVQANSDDLSDMIEEIKQHKENLDKFDAAVAEMYAARCKKTSTELMNLMKKGGWLNAAETKEWGFVDEITEFESDEKPELSSSDIKNMITYGIPIPALKEKEVKPETFISRLFRNVAECFNYNKETETMKKKFIQVGTILEQEEFELEEGRVSLSEEQMDKINTALAEFESNTQEKDKTITDLTNEIAELKKKPGEETKQVVNEQKSENEVTDFITTMNSAKELYELIS